MGISGLAKKVRAIVQRVRGKIDKAIERALVKAKKAVKKSVKKGKPTTKEQKQRTVNDAVNDAVAAVDTKYGDREVSQEKLIPVLEPIKIKYKLKTLKPVEMGDNWGIYAKVNPDRTKKTTSRQNKFETEVNQQLATGNISPGRAKDLLEYNRRNPSGKRTIEQVNQEFDAGKQLTDRGDFYDPKRSQPPDFKAKIAIGHSEVQDSTINDFQELKQKRKRAKIAKDEAEKKHGQSSAEYKKYQQQMVNASENLGETATKEAIDNLHPDVKPLKSETLGGGKQGEFDRIYEDPSTGKIIIAEAKGGKSPLGSRKVSGGKRAQQGTPQYRDDIIKNMRDRAKKTGDVELLETAEKLEQAVRDGN